MSQDKAGPVVIGERVQIKRKHAYNCANCSRWDQLKDEQGICRRLPPVMQVIGLGEGMDRTPRPVTYPIYNMTVAGDVCAFHPELLRDEIVSVLRLVFQAWDSRVSWDREKGFNRAPGLSEAQRFAVAPDVTEGKSG
jgi:hypothetical protein